MIRLVAATRIIRTTVSQETRVILPPLNMAVNTANGKMPVEEDFLGKPNVDYELSKDLAEWKRGYFLSAPNEAAPADAIRRVQILIPTIPKVVGDLDCYPELVGVNRANYKLPPLIPGQQIRLHLMPGQWLVAAAEEGKAHMSLVVEYLAPAPDFSRKMLQR